jgi:2-polyprenyl-6-hydroxyphenyl methylase/3-demethylubiquinone-9 3-methyltransferase
MRTPWDWTSSTSRGPGNPFLLPKTPVVYCCDVLEHVRDLPKVIGEIYRVTKPGGVLFFDMLNRTFVSKLAAIKIWREWKSTAFMPPRLHEWRMFIRPEELKGLFAQAGFELKEFRGTS